MARRQRNIYKRRDGRYEARFVKERSRNGKAIYGSVYDRTYAGVKEKLKVSRRLKKLPGTRKQVVLVLENYLETHKILIKPSTYWVYHGYIQNHIRPYFTNACCNELSQESIQAFVSEKLKSGLSAIMVRSVFTFLKKGLDETVSCEAFRVKFPKHTGNKLDVLTISEQKRLEAAAEASDDINRVGIIVCLYTGIRIGELCGLMWQDIDFDGRQLHVRRTIQRIKSNGGNTKTVITFMPPKSNSSWRSIPLPEFLLTILRGFHEKNPGEYVLSLDGHAVEPRVMQYRFRRLLAQAGISLRSFHITRHSFSVRALENGFDIKTLSEILGHSSPIITLKKYAHVLDEHKRKSMESMSLVYGNKNFESGQKSGHITEDKP